VLATTAPGPLDEEREGREMLYSSGTTGRPKGVRKQLPATVFGDPRAAPVIVAQGIAQFGTEGKLYKRLLRERYWAGHGSLVI
jgi:long-chain acyl-CoA synthetase